MNRRNKLKYDNKQHYIHRLIAEKALGKTLPEGCVIHHHTDTQLVICENHKYHMLLHQRMRALKACGHASWRKCNFCGEYDKPTNLWFNDKQGYHMKCKRQYDRQYYAKRLHCS